MWKVQQTFGLPGTRLWDWDMAFGTWIRHFGGAGNSSSDEGEVANY